MDDTLKQWDLRKFTEPVGMANDLYIFHEEANAIYSPNERFIVAGTAGRKGGSGKIVVYEKNTMELVKQVDCDASVVKLMWPSQLNQLFVGLSNGNIRVLYDPETSQGGVTIPLSKAPKKLAVDDYDLVMYNPIDLVVGSKYKVKWLILNQYQKVKKKKFKVPGQKIETEPNQVKI